MITFKDDNKLIELSINDYQYPEITEGYYDCDWLNAHLHANDGKQQWNKNDSAFLTFDLPRITYWFAQLAAISLNVKSAIDKYPVRGCYS